MSLKRTIFVAGFLLLAVVTLQLQRGQADGPSVTITIDVAANRHAINPNIYGVAFASTTRLNELNAP